MLNTLIVTALFLGQAPTDKLAIKDDTVGTGPALKSGDIVSVDYTGTLANGTQFDTSIGRAPFMFIVGAGQVIKGWDQGFLGMHEGGKRELTVPPSLGYGATAAGPIPANSVLHFTVTLLKIEPTVEITVLTPGTGTEQAKIGDEADVFFSGGIKGKSVLFDTHDKSKEPVPILIGERRLPIGFIPALVGMKQGEKRKVDIPAPIAYGDKGVPPQDRGDVKAGSVIPPNSVMEFTFELVKLVKAKA